MHASVDSLSDTKIKVGTSEPLVDVRGLRVQFAVRGTLGRRRGVLRAVDDVSFRIDVATTLGLVGESGCGKTSLARAMVRLIPATGGSVRIAGTDVLTADRKTLRSLRRDMQIVFQDPYGSLDPRMPIERIIGEPLEIHRVARGREIRERVAELLERVGLATADAHRYPHELSGGQRQRVAVARAIALHPKFVVCDEPVSALDVSIQAQILNLLHDLQRDLGLTYLFITHDLAVARHVSDQLAVMYLGKIVETAPAAEALDRPQHPYTAALRAAVPLPDPNTRPEPTRPIGEPPDPVNPPAGCAYHPRCPHTTDRCRRETPRLQFAPGCGPRHLVACHHPENLRSNNDDSYCPER